MGAYVSTDGESSFYKQLAEADEWLFQKAFKIKAWR